MTVATPIIAKVTTATSSRIHLSTLLTGSRSTGARFMVSAMFPSEAIKAAAPSACRPICHAAFRESASEPPLLVTHHHRRSLRVVVLEHGNVRRTAYRQHTGQSACDTGQRMVHQHIFSRHVQFHVDDAGAPWRDGDRLDIL